MSDYASLPYVCVLLFLPPGEINAAQVKLRALKRGDTKADLSAALAEAVSHARGYRIEWADQDEAAAERGPAPVAGRGRPRLLGRR